MKKIVYILFLILSFVGFKANSQNITLEKLPSEAQNFITSNIKSLEILSIEKDREFTNSKFEVLFSDGTKIEFNSKGNWTEIKSNNGISDNLIPKSISDYVNSKHPNIKIIQIEKEKKRIEVKLDNKIEIIFDSNGKFLRYDS